MGLMTIRAKKRFALLLPVVPPATVPGLTVPEPPAQPVVPVPQDELAALACASAKRNQPPQTSYVFWEY